jgi:hypothetical protein
MIIFAILQQILLLYKKIRLNMHIQTVVSRSSSFSELLSIAECAEAKFSFWGSRYVCVSGYEGEIDVNALASRTMELLKELNYEFSLTEHRFGRRLAARIDKLYDDQSRLVSQANWFSQFLDTLRILPCGIFNYFIYGNQGVYSRWRGQDDTNDTFTYYTRTQFQSAFRMSPEEAQRRDFIFDHLHGRADGPPDRWSVKGYLLSLARSIASNSTTQAPI